MNQFSQSEITVRHIAGPPLRKLIRSKATKAFLTQDGAWTEDISSAAVFKDHSAAIAAKHRFNLDGEAELYYSFNDRRQSQYDFTMTL